MKIVADTLDDLLMKVYKHFIKRKNTVSATRGKFFEEIGVLLVLTNPRARVSRSESKGTIFSCLGELFWYLARTNRLNFIKYYIKEYSEDSDDGKSIYGAYGPRLFKMRGKYNQIENVIKLLKDKSSTRRAVIQLFDARDLAAPHKEIPCTCTLQFFIRDQRLHMYTNMRSNDVFKGLHHDIFAFTMLQEIFARTLGIELGEYKHSIGSLHLYDKDKKRAAEFIKEGHQSTIQMPSMPEGDPWPSIDKLLKVEKGIRTNRALPEYGSELEEYWLDWIRLLQAYALKRHGTETIELYDAIHKDMHSETYHIFIKRLRDNRLNNGIPS